MNALSNAPRVGAAVLHAVGLAVALGLLALVQQLWRLHLGGWALGLLALTGVLLWVQWSARAQAWRYVLPGVLAVMVFVVLPIGFTVAIGLTNYSASNLLSFERATAALLERTDSRGQGMDLALWRLAPAHSDQPDQPDQTERSPAGTQRLQATLQADDGSHWRSAPFDLAALLAEPAPGAAPARQRVPLQPMQPLQPHPAAPPDAAGASAAAVAAMGTPAPGQVLLAPRDRVALLPQLQAIDFVMPDGQTWRLSGLSRVSDQVARYARVDDNTLRDLADGRLVRADHASGLWRTVDGTALSPGFRTGVGLANYERIFTDPRFFAPFARVLAWTLSFATLNTLFTFGLGLLLAVALNWEALRGKAFYRVALFLPYAVPAFISIPIFRGLFNENLGEINLVLDLLFGVRPGWFSDASLARAMVLLVNTWLGYPYMMILAMGLLKAIPADLYEASALAGATPWDNLWRITLPLVARPMAPLLIASFATNFNNLTLIALLTEGGPDYLDTDVPVGATDLLASYTYRIAFADGGQNYALACAISTLVFALVAALAVINLRLFGARR